MIDMTSIGEHGRYAFALLNLLLCSLIGYTCGCRMSRMSAATTSKRFRFQYVLLFVAATASGFAPVLWREWPGPSHIGVSIAVLVFLGFGYRNWRDGPPDYARRGPGWFEPRKSE